MEGPLALRTFRKRSIPNCVAFGSSGVAVCAAAAAVRMMMGKRDLRRRRTGNLLWKPTKNDTGDARSALVYSLHVKAAAIFRFLVCWFVLFAISDLPAAHKKRRQLTAPEAVVAAFEKMISSGALLTPNGWEKASKLFQETKAYPNDGDIRIVYPGMVGEWAQESIANVGCQLPCVVESS